MKLVAVLFCVLLASHSISAISQANFFHESSKAGYKQMIDFQAGQSVELDMSLEYHFLDLELNSDAEFKNWVIQEQKTMRTLMDSLKPKQLKHDLYSKVEVSPADTQRVKVAVEKAQGKLNFKNVKLNQLAAKLAELIASSSAKTVIVVTKVFRSAQISPLVLDNTQEAGSSDVSSRVVAGGESMNSHFEHADYHRVMQAGNTTVKNGTTPSKVYVKPDAVFGILLSIFIFFITYIGVMCLYDVKTPRNFAQKQLKFGKEM